jgi:hypothetical protein
MVGRVAVLGALALVTAGMAACGHQNTNGQSSSYLYIDSLQGASGAKPDVLANTLQSDVITYVKTTVNAQEVYVPTIYDDMALVSMKMSLKDVGGANSPTLPTFSNTITVTRYHVEYRRADGRNTPGVDVPYPFDGGATASFNANGNTMTFVLVRAQAKQEAPLAALRGGGGANSIAAIAYVTFYGADQNGNSVSVTGTISVTFADWGDPLV